MINKQIMGYFLTILKLNDAPKVYSYIMDSTMCDPSVLYKYFLTDIAKIYDIDPVFFYDEDAIFIILDNIPLPTYEDFCYELDEGLTRKIVDTKENITIVYTLFDGITVD